MAIPDYQSCMLPLLEFLGDQNEHSLRETIDHLTNHFKLTEEELKQLLPSGQQAVFDNRVAWARTYLKQAGLLEPTRRGYFRITPRGLEVLKQKPEKINVKFLEQFKEFRDFRQRKRKPHDKTKETHKEDIEKTPAEALEAAYENVRDCLLYTSDAADE